MLELPPAAAEEQAQKMAEKLHYLPFVFGIYEQSVGAQMPQLMDMSNTEMERQLRVMAAVAIDAVKIIMEEYK